MKRILALVLIGAIIATVCCVNVFADSTVKGLSYIPEEYSKYVAEAIEKSEFTEEEIDVDKIFIVENTSHINLNKNLGPIMFWVALPIIDSTDISYAGFEKGGFVKAFTNFVSLDGMIPPYDGKLDKYIEVNKLSEPTEIKNMWISERVHVFAYNVICDGNEYIIPYYFTDESSFNKMENESCVMELGKAYSVDEFVSLCEKEAELYAAYMAEERKKDNRPTVYIDKDGEEAVKGGNTASDNEEKYELPKDDFSENDSDEKAPDESVIHKSDEDKNEVISVDLSVEEKVENLIELGIVEGDPDGNLRLDENITRAEFTKVICKALNAAPAPTSVAPYFSDVDANFWAFGYIETARQYGLIKGYGDDQYHPTFKPYNNITYSESFKMIVEMLGYGLFAEDLGGFPDGYKTVTLQDLELFRASVPDYSAPITRGELFEIVYNALDVPIIEVYNRTNREFKIMNGVYDDTPLKTLRMALENRQQKLKG